MKLVSLVYDKKTKKLLKINTRTPIPQSKSSRRSKKGRHGQKISFFYWIFDQLKFRGMGFVTPDRVIDVCFHRTSAIVENGMSVEEFIKTSKLKVSVAIPDTYDRINLTVFRNNKWAKSEAVDIRDLQKLISRWRQKNLLNAELSQIGHSRHR